MQVSEDTGLIYSVLQPTSGLGPGTQEAVHMCSMDKATLDWLGLGLRDEALLFTCTPRERTIMGLALPLAKVYIREQSPSLG